MDRPESLRHRPLSNARSDASGDYGVQAVSKKQYKKRKWPRPAVMLKIAKPRVPYRSIACWYLGKSLDIKTVEE